MKSKSYRTFTLWIIFLFFAPIFVFGQSRYTSIVLCDSVSRERIEHGEAILLESNDLLFSNRNGELLIPSSPGEEIVFQALGYSSQTLHSSVFLRSTMDTIFLAQESSSLLETVELTPKDALFYLKEFVRHREKNHPEYQANSLHHFQKEIYEDNQLEWSEEALLASNVVNVKDSTKEHVQVLLHRYLVQEMDLNVFQDKMEKSIEKEAEEQDSKEELSREQIMANMLESSIGDLNDQITLATTALYGIDSIIGKKTNLYMDPFFMADSIRYVKLHIENKKEQRYELILNTQDFSCASFQMYYPVDLPLLMKPILYFAGIDLDNLIFELHQSTSKQGERYIAHLSEIKFYVDVSQRKLFKTNPRSHFLTTAKTQYLRKLSEDLKLKDEHKYSSEKSNAHEQQHNTLQVSW